MPWLDLARASVGVLLIASAVAKAVSSSSVEPFLLALGLPTPVRRALSGGLPIVEVSCGALLLAGSTGWTAWPAAALTTGFAATLAWARLMGVTESCRCLGSLDRPDQSSHVSTLRSVLLAVVSVATAVAVQSSTSHPVTLAEVAIGALAAGVYVALFAILGSVWQFRRLSASDRTAAAAGAAAGPAREGGRP